MHAARDHVPPKPKVEPPNRGSTRAPKNSHPPDPNPIWHRLATRTTPQDLHLQAKLKVGAPNDEHEREADRVADQVMRTSSSTVDTPVIQRLCPECEEEMQRQPVEDEEEEELQAKLDPGAGGQQVDSKTAATIRSMRGGGQPLPATERAYFEPRLGRDLSQVRLHAGADAARLSSQIRAQMFTYGADIFFGQGHRDPGSNSSRRLLAHELTHVVQQGYAPPSRSPVARDQIVQAAPKDRILPYRDKKSEFFDKAKPITALGALGHEQTYKKDEDHPLVENVSVSFTSLACESGGGCAMPKGALVANYDTSSEAFKKHKAELGSGNITLAISGGSVEDGLTDRRSGQKVCRIEGKGYVSSVSRPGTAGEMSLEPGEEWSKSKRYVKLKGKDEPGVGNMDFAVFFKRSGAKCVQAIHGGALDTASLACVHAGTSSSALEKLQQINYHSAVGKTTVDVSYDESVLLKLCAHRLHHGDGRIWTNPCNQFTKKKIKEVDPATLTCTACGT